MGGERGRGLARESPSVTPPSPPQHQPGTSASPSSSIFRALSFRDSPSSNILKHFTRDNETCFLSPPSRFPRRSHIRLKEEEGVGCGGGWRGVGLGAIFILSLSIITPFFYVGHKTVPRNKKKMEHPSFRRAYASHTHKRMVITLVCRFVKARRVI